MFFIHNPWGFISLSFSTNLVYIHDRAEISKLCQKVFKRFCMPSKSVMKVNIMKLKCLFENKRLTIIFNNLNCSSKAFSWWQKLFSRLLKKTSKRRQKMSFFSWDERTNFERTKDVHFTSRADWWIIHAFHDPPHLDFSLMKG